LLHFIKTLSNSRKDPINLFGHFQNENPVMKTLVTRFLRDQTGAAEFDGMTVFLLTVVFPIAVYFMSSTFGGVFDAVFGWAADAAHVR
jgi:Flp pilus assembly pilin Flp